MKPATTLGFTAAFQDPVTAAYPLGNGYRFFHPALMRFVAPDEASPFGAGGPNPYAYCGDDPINRIDPTGHVSLSVIKNAAETVEEAAHDQETDALIATEKTTKTQDISEVFLQIVQMQRGLKKWRKWVAYIGARRHDIETISALLPSMGQPVKSLKEFKQYLLTERVMVQANGKPGTLLGHSAFYHDDATYELLLMRHELARDLPYRAKRPTLSPGPYRVPEDFSYISIGGKVLKELSESKSEREKIDYIINKGNIHLLNEEYSKHFEEAFKQERSYFADQNFSYGWHYNCHGLIRKVLQRLLDLTLSTDTA